MKSLDLKKQKKKVISGKFINFNNENSKFKNLSINYIIQGIKMTAKMTFILAFIQLSSFYTVKEVVSQFPDNRQEIKKTIIDPKNYLTKTVKQRIYKHMDQIVLNKNFVGSKIVLIIIDKYEMNDVWFKFIQRFVQNIITQIFSNPIDRYNTLFALYSIQDKEYQIRIGSKLAKIYQSDFALYNIGEVKKYLKQNKYQQAFEIFYKNIDLCINKNKSYCSDYYLLRKITFDGLSIFVLIIQSIKIIYYALKKFISLRNKKHSNLCFTNDQITKNKIQKIYKLDSCTICLENIKEKKQVEVFLKCGHNFHQNCINKWLDKHNTCPFCKTLLSSKQNKNLKLNRLDIRLELLSCYFLGKNLFFTQNSQFDVFLCMQWTNKIFDFLAHFGNIVEYFFSVRNVGIW